MVAVRADKKKIDPRYLFAVLRSPLVQDSIDRMHVGTMIPHFKKSDFNQLLIPTPDRRTQKFIGDVHMALVEKIELNQRMNETLETTARAIFQDWFVDFGPTRAKVEGGAPYLAPDVWSLFPDRFADPGAPEQWNFGSLADVAQVNPENWSRANYPDRLKYVDLSNTKWGTIEVVTAYSDENAPSRAQRILRPGDTIIGTVRPGNGSYAYVSEVGLTGSTGFAVLRSKEPMFREIVYLASTSKKNIDRLAHLADGGAYPAVRPELVLETEFVAGHHGTLIAEFSASTKPLIDRAEANKWGKSGFSLKSVISSSPGSCRATFVSVKWNRSSDWGQPGIFSPTVRGRAQR